MFLTGPDVIAAVTGESVTSEVLGGADARQAVRPGVVRGRRRGGVPRNGAPPHLVPALQQHGAAAVLPARRRSGSILRRAARNRAGLATGGLRRPPVIEVLVDDGELLEIQPAWAPSCAVWPASTVMSSASWPTSRPCSPAPSTSTPPTKPLGSYLRRVQHPDRLARRRARLPPRRAAGAQRHHPPRRQAAVRLRRRPPCRASRSSSARRSAAYIVMDSRALGADLCFAWPSNEIAVMGPVPANVIFKREIAGAADRGQAGGVDRAVRRRLHAPVRRGRARTRR